MAKNLAAMTDEQLSERFVKTCKQQMLLERVALAPFYPFVGLYKAAARVIPKGYGAGAAVGRGMGIILGGTLLSVGAVGAGIAAFGFLPVLGIAAGVAAFETPLILAGRALTKQQNEIKATLKDRGLNAFATFDASYGKVEKALVFADMVATELPAAIASGFNAEAQKEAPAAKPAPSAQPAVPQSPGA